MTPKEWKAIGLFGVLLLVVGWWSPEAAKWVAAGTVIGLVALHPDVLTGVFK